MTAIGTFIEGIRRMLRAPGLVFAIWASSFVVAAPLATFMVEAIHDFTAASEYHEVLEKGFDTGWYAEFSDSGSIQGTLSPTHVGIGAWLANLDRWWDGRVFQAHPVILSIAAGFVLLWLLLLGGVLESMREGAARPRLATVLADGLRFFPRLLRITMVSAVGYVLVFRLARWIFPKIHDLTAEKTTETEILFSNLAGALVIVLLLGAVRLVSDYAKIAVVIERRKSALISVLRGVRFVASNPARVCTIALFYTASMAALFGLYSIASPGAADSSPPAILFAFATSQLFLLIKQALRVGFLASEVACFELNR